MATEQEQSGAEQQPVAQKAQTGRERKQRSKRQSKRIEGAEKKDDVVQTVARVSEPVFTGASAVASVVAVAGAVAGDIPVVGPLVAVAVTGLLPVVSAAIERDRAARSERAERARANADAAWDAIIAAREG